MSLATPLTRRNCLRHLGLATTLCTPALVWGTPGSLPLAVSLSDEATRASAQAQALIVMVSLAGCPFCHTVRQHHLLPLQAQGQAVVQVDMRDNRPLHNFQGQTLSHDAQTRQWGIKVAPTLLFLGPQGQELAERLTGGYLPDFYGSYLDGRLNQARQALKRL